MVDTLREENTNMIFNETRFKEKKSKKTRREVHQHKILPSSEKTEY